VTGLCFAKSGCLHDVALLGSLLAIGSRSLASKNVAVPRTGRPASGAIVMVKATP
jgi:hypothetical protein